MGFVLYRVAFCEIIKVKSTKFKHLSMVNKLKKVRIEKKLNKKRPKMMEAMWASPPWTIHHTSLPWTYNAILLYFPHFITLSIIVLVICQELKVT